ncbi:ring-cleaving dioxygenase [Pseudalkalibacillus sp. SCS-8]|uniref:ring-cleaving dioxygenase n=1 Tax=Pseudalkalibacillus nanhaiensis TaxID=3115291 RepID=UPI0032DB55BF
MSDKRSLKGIHHVSAITGDAKRNYQFYTKILGMRLVKKTINQDDPSVYHLFYADERGNPGTDLTFFEIPMAGQTYYGTSSISTSSLRVPSDAAINYWKKRFIEFEVDHDEISHVNGRLALPFRDFEGQRLMFVSDETNTGVKGGKPWEKSPVPEEFGIVGLGPVFITIPKLEKTEQILLNVLGFNKKNSYDTQNRNVDVYETGEGGTGAEVHLMERTDLPPERPGRGSVHHVAFRVENEEELHKWVDYIKELRIPNSGFVERYYFKSLYFREPNGVLFELATDGPGFEGDEPFETLGESLALPPYFEKDRKEIEEKLKPLDTKE